MDSELDWLNSRLQTCHNLRQAKAIACQDEAADIRLQIIRNCIGGFPEVRDRLVVTSPHEQAAAHREQHRDRGVDGSAGAGGTIAAIRRSQPRSEPWVIDAFCTWRHGYRRPGGRRQEW